MTKPTKPTKTTPTATTTDPTTLWLTDRSRWKLGTSRCARARYLSYHAGPTGYGMTAARDSLPLATGIGVHRGLETFSAILKDYDRLPDLDETRALIGGSVAEYLARVEERGFRGILDSEETREIVSEQATLIEGLLWVLRLKFLPWLHATYRVIRVEEERLHLLGDDKALMIRTDLLAQRRGSSSLSYFECKTTGWESDAWAEQWETDPQLALGTVDARELWGAEVTELYIIALNKGRRTRSRYEEDDHMKRQQSPLCYGYCKPSNPPLAPDDWVPSYEWVNEDGETKRKSRAHRRRGIWTLEESDWPTWLNYRTANPGMTPSEFWTRFLPPNLVDRVCFTLGPMNRQDEQLKTVLRGFEGEESRWQQVMWDLYAVQQQGHGWASEAFQTALDKLVPCSWACRPFGKDHQCEFLGICHRHIGWDDPLGSGHYVPRRPHHQPELDQAVARGLIVAEAAEVDDDDTNT